MKRVFYSAFVWKCTDMCQHRFGVQVLQNPRNVAAHSLLFCCHLHKSTMQLRSARSPVLFITVFLFDTAYIFFDSSSSLE